MAITRDFIVPDGLTVGSEATVASANVTGNARIGGNLNVVGNITGPLTVSNTVTFSNNVTIAGSLTVSGTTTYVNTATLNVADNIITLNADLPASSAPTENSGIEVNRGNAANVALRWSESAGVWTVTQDGTNFGRIHSKLTDIALGTDTSGDYVATISVANGISGAVTGEGSTPTLRVVPGTGVTANATGVHIGQDVATTASPTFTGILKLQFANTSVAGIPTVSSEAANGTIASPTQTTAGATIFRVSPTAYTGSAYTGGAKIEAIATENITALARGTRWDFTAIVAGGADGSVMSWNGSNLTLNTVNVATQTFSSNATNLTSGTIPYGRIPANIANTTSNFSIDGLWTFNANVTFGAADHIILSSTSGISANGGFGTAGQVLHSNGSSVYWAVDDNTTYDLLAVANAAVNAGLLRLSDSSSSNDTVTFTGTGAATVASNSTHIIINANDTNETYVIKNIANSLPNEARIQLLPTDDPSSNSTAKFVGGGTTTVSANTTALLISSADQYTGTVTSVGSGNGLTGGPISGSGTLSVVAGNAIVSNSSGVHHSDTSSVTNLTASGRTYVTGLTFDTYGHVTGYTTGTETVTDTDTLQSISDDTSTNATYYPSFVTSTSGAQTGKVSSTKLTFNPSSGFLFSTGLSTTAAFRETRTTTSGNAINLNNGSYFTHTVSGSTTFSVTNVPSSGTAVSFILDITNGGSAAVTWWSGIKWPNGYAPALTTSGRDLLGFTTYDGGTTWAGLVLGYDVK